MTTMDTLKNIESVVKIYFTTDYKRFKFIEGNRLLSEKKIKKLMDTIGGGLDILKYAPIIVDEDYNIIDGQHRYYVSHKLKQNVYYIIASKKNISEIAKINSATDKWKAKDFLESYITTGNKHYLELEAFMTKYKFPLGSAITLLTHGKVYEGSGRVLENFREGYFKIENRDKAYHIADLLMDYRKYTILYKHRSFMVAIARLSVHENYDHKRMMDKLKQSKIEIERKTSTKDYIIQLMSIFNFHNQKFTNLL